MRRREKSRSLSMDCSQPPAILQHASAVSGQLELQLLVKVSGKRLLEA